MRKLAAYITSMLPKELNSRNKGINKICTIISEYLMAYRNITAVRMMLGGCGSQENKQYTCCICNLLIIVFLRHSEMECDSIHSKLKLTLTNDPVCVPKSWTLACKELTSKSSCV